MFRFSNGVGVLVKSTNEADKRQKIRAGKWQVNTGGFMVALVLSVLKY